MNSLCDVCGGMCCKVKIFSPGWLQTSGAKSVCLDGETDNKVVDGYTLIYKTCNHLKSGKCNIYDERPQSCRDFLVGSEMCKMAMMENIHD